MVDLGHSVTLIPQRYSRLVFGGNLDDSIYPAQVREQLAGWVVKVPEVSRGWYIWSPVAGDGKTQLASSLLLSVQSKVTQVSFFDTHKLVQGLNDWDSDVQGVWERRLETSRIFLLDDIDYVSEKQFPMLLRDVLKPLDDLERIVLMTSHHKPSYFASFGDIGTGIASRIRGLCNVIELANMGPDGDLRVRGRKS